MTSIVRKVLEIYLRDKRIVTLADFNAEEITLAKEQSAVFVTIYANNRVIASEGRIKIKKENTLQEIIDLTYACVKDDRFWWNVQTLEMLANLKIRVDILENNKRRILSSIDSLNTVNEGIIFLSQNLWKLSVILPGMIPPPATSQLYLQYALSKAWVDQNIDPKNYVIYWFTSRLYSDL